MKKKEFKQNEFGLWIETEVEFEKREKMTRTEWRAWYAIEEITEEEFRNEYTRTNRPLDN